MLLAVAAAAMTVPAGWAAAKCEFDGTAPGTVAKTYAVGAGGQTIYVDDRDYADADDDGVAGGIWVYLESNHVAGLQRGGDQAAVGKIPGTVPYIPPTFVGVPGSVVGVTLFPSGFGGGSISQAAGGHDPCTDSATPDTLLSIYVDDRDYADAD
jgi:hypothetical protein